MEKRRAENKSKQKMIEIEGVECPVFVGSLMGQKLAVVSQNVLQHLITLLPKAPFYEVRSDFINDVERTENMKEFMGVLTSEVEFRLSVQMMEIFYAPPEPVADESGSMKENTEPGRTGFLKEDKEMNVKGL